MGKGLMFKGRYETNLDSKGRTSLPAKFRHALADADENRIVLTTALDPCLAVYPYSGWREFEKRIAKLPGFDPSVIQLKRLYVAGAVECPVDGHGRILLPPVLREYAGVTREVVWCGMVDYVELWDQQRWNDAYSAARNGATGLGKALADLGL